MAHVRWLDIVVLTLYFGGITLAGLWFSKRNKSTEDYFLGGRNFPGWAIGLSMGLSGLVIAAVLAASMSSLDSSINAIATLTIVDVYRRHLVKGKEDAHYLRVAQYIAIVASVLMIGVALWYDTLDIKTFQDMGFILAALLGCGIFGLFMLGFLTTWGDGRAVALGVILTMAYATFMVARHFEWLPGWFPDYIIPYTDEYYTGLIANVLLFLVGFIAGGLLPGKKRDLTNLTVWTQDDTPLV